MILVHPRGYEARRRFRLEMWRSFIALLAAVFPTLALAVPAKQLKPAALRATARFEVASIRMVPESDAGLFSMSPSGAGLFTMRNVNLRFAIAWAFLVDSDRVSGAPNWIDRQQYDISARPEGDAGLSYEQLRPLLQQLFRRRFHLACHHVTKNFKGFALVGSSKSIKASPAKGGATYGYLLANGIDAQNVSTKTIADLLSKPLGQPVEDKTGLKGNYDLHIKFAPFDQPNSSLPSIFTAVEQLGLKLKRQKYVSVETLMIDHLDRVPTPN